MKIKVSETSETPDAMVTVMELIEAAIGRILLREIEKKKIGEMFNMMKTFKKGARVDNIRVNEDTIDDQLGAMTVLETGRLIFNWQKINTIIEGQLVDDDRKNYFGDNATTLIEGFSICRFSICLIAQVVETFTLD